MDDPTDAGVELRLSLPVSTETLFARDATNDLITFLARRAGKAYTVSDLADRTGHSRSSVSRAADSLVESGLVDETTDGTSRRLSIDPRRVSAPDDPVVRIPQKEFHNPTRCAAEQIWTELENVLGIVVYGSVARGEADRLSDIDLWVLVETDRAENQRRANAVRVELEDRKFGGDRYGFDIDVECVRSLPTYADSVRHILSEGITIKKPENFCDIEKYIYEINE